MQAVTVSDVPAPTVTLTFSPDPPRADQQATFIATVLVVVGHSIRSYFWNFGDGTSQTTTVPTVTKTYANQGTYVATVTVTDDLGQTGSDSEEIVITGSTITATIQVSPTDPAAGERIHFTALNPTGNGTTITSYAWNFGDSAISGGGTASGQAAEHTYATGSTYVVTLTITDSAGNVGNVTATVTVA